MQADNFIWLYENLVSGSYGLPESGLGKHQAASLRAIETLGCLKKSCVNQTNRNIRIKLPEIEN